MIGWIDNSIEQDNGYQFCQKLPFHLVLKVWRGSDGVWQWFFGDWFALIENGYEQTEARAKEKAVRAYCRFVNKGIEEHNVLMEGYGDRFDV